MKKRLLVVAFFSVFTCNAQNYQCLQSGVKHFFTNANGYLRGIRIDSTLTLGDTTVFYPFRTPRGGYDRNNLTFSDTIGGCWLGKKVNMLPDGKFIFDSYWNDSVIIKTKANVGDNWVFYRDAE